LDFSVKFVVAAGASCLHHAFISIKGVDHSISLPLGEEDTHEYLKTRHKDSLALAFLFNQGDTKDTFNHDF
jgi:hypothetical protein